MVQIIIIAALAKNNVIGNEGKIPWHISEDFKRFKRVTLGYPVIMGRKTYETLPIRPLPERENIVLTRDENYHLDDAKVFNSIHRAIEYCKEKYDKIFIIGGTSVYRQALEFADTLDLTRIHKDIEGDAKFPPIDLDEWRLVKEEKHIDEKEGEYSFLIYDRGSKKMNRMNDIEEFDPKIAKVIKDEITRQEEGAEMIASENFVSKAVMQAMGSVLTNKYSEGYPNRRYYGGNEFIDISESLAIERVKELFDAEHANVQPHSGSQANAAVYLALLNPGDTILGMSLDAGGHLTHGSPVNFSGKYFNIVSYGVDKNGILDMEEVRKKAHECKPKLILAGFSAYPRSLDFEKFREIADEVGAYLMADIAHIAGLVAAGVHPSPFPHCDVVTTTTHKTLRGPRSGLILSVKEDRVNPDTKKNLAQKIDSAVFPGSQGGPLDHVIAAKAVAFKEALMPEFKEYQEQIVKNAKALAETLVNEGIGVVSGGTDNHLVLIDLTSLRIGGKEAEGALDMVHIFTNKNMIPNDPRSPFDPSGIRVGTPALTTRGLKEEEMKVIGKCIADTLKNTQDQAKLAEIKKTVMKLIEKFPLYPGLSILK